MKHSKACFRGEDALWQPFSLKFESAAVEAAFHTFSLLDWMLHDFVTCSLGMAFTCIFLSSLDSSLPLFYILFGVVVAAFFSPTAIYLYLCRRDLFAQWRPSVFGFIRLGICTIFSSAGFYMKAPEPTVFSVIKAYIAVSPINFLSFVAMACRLEFRYHILLHTVQTLLAVSWIPTFCQTCSADPALAETFHKMGYGLDSSFSYLILGREPEMTVYPCWMITGYALVTLGVVLPNLFVLWTELSARLAFAQTKIVTSQHEANTLQSYFHEAARVTVFAAVSLTVGAWWGLCLMRDVLFPQYSVLQR